MNIELYKDNILIGTSTGSTFTYEWNSTADADGPHTFVSKAYDAAGNVGTSTPIVIDVDNTAPTAAITTPSNGAIFKCRMATISANATDSSGIQKVDFHYDTTLIGTNTSGLLTLTGTFLKRAGDGAHSLYVVATDTLGNSTTSPAISVTVDYLAPTVALTNPVYGEMR